jgi:curli biogenesis system outer membrane secretion channel CsgG
MGTKLLETEAGFTQNESITYAVRKAIETSVIELVKKGEKNKLWEFKKEEEK